MSGEYIHTRHGIKLPFVGFIAESLNPFHPLHPKLPPRMLERLVQCHRMAGDHRESAPVCVDYEGFVAGPEAEYFGFERFRIRVLTDSACPILTG